MSKRIYVAGAYSADNELALLHNIRSGIRLAKRVWLAGYFPFCPWLDFQLLLSLESGEFISVEECYRMSMAWLEVSDAVLVGDWEGCDKSKGTASEIARANELGIPVYRSLAELEAAQ